MFRPTKASHLNSLKTILVIFLLTLVNTTFAQDYPVVQMIKRNASSFAIDGNNGATDAQDVYLWSENENNANQQWYEIDRGSGYYSYQKVSSNHCLDGGNGGDNAQNVYLWTCSSSNQNQHWLKVAVGGGHYRLEKRNASGFSIDGNAGGANSQSIYLWGSNNSNQNQHWQFNYVSDGSNPGGGNCDLPWTSSSISINDESVTDELGQVDISCVDDVTISMNIEGSGPMENADYLNIYYRVNDGALQEISSNTNAFGQQNVSVSGVSGNNIEIVVEGYTSFNNETYTVSNISIVEGDDNNGQVPPGFTELTSLDQLHSAFASSNGNYKLKAGNYVADELLSDEVTVFRVTGHNNTFDFTGATIDIPTALLSEMGGTVHSYASWKLEGNDNTFIGGTFINSYPDGSTEVTDFNAHNNDRSRQPGGSNVNFRVWGNNNTFIDNTMIVRGSFPYGYGDMFGKGGGSTYGLRKHGAIQVVGDNTLIEGLDLTVQAFGHGIFMQGADNTVIRDTTVKGRIRLGADMYNDGANSLPGQLGFIQPQPYWYEGVPIPHDRMYNLTEDGIRAYASGTKLDGSVSDTGSVYVENTNVINMRNCFALVAADSAELDNVEVQGCTENGFSLPSGGTLTNGRGDAAFASLIQMPYGNVRNTYMDVTVIEPNYTTGSFPFTQIAGSGHTVILRSDGNPIVGSNRIMVGYGWDRWEHDNNDAQQSCSDTEIFNYTAHPVELTEHSSGITGTSNGQVIDNGSNNDVD